MNIRALTFLAVTTLLTTLPALAQTCTPNFASGYDLGSIVPDTSGGIEGAAIQCSTVFDDHSGTGPALFVAGAGFTIPGSGRVYLAKFADGRWHAIPGFNNPIYAMTVQGANAAAKLIVGGNFTAIPGGQAANRIASFDGTTWTPMGALSTVRSLLAVDEPSGAALYAGGANAASLLPFLAKWDGAAWTDIALPTSTRSSGSDNNTGVRALASFDDGSGPKLYVAASRIWGAPNAFGVVAFDGSTWTPITGLTGTSISSEVTGFHVINEPSGPQLYLAGMFASPTQSEGPIARLVAGSWQLINGNGLFGRGAAAITSINTPQGTSLVAAVGQSAHRADRVRTYRDGVWSDLTGAFANDSGIFSIRSLAILPEAGQLTALGNFARIGTTLAPGAASWNGSSWTSIEPLGIGLPAGSSVLIDPENPTSAYVAGRRYASGVTLPLDLPFAPTSLLRLSQPTSTLVVTKFNTVQLNNGSGWTSLLMNDVPPINRVWIATDTGAETLVAESSLGLHRFANGAWSQITPSLNLPQFADVITYDDGQGPELYAGATYSAARGVQPLFAAIANNQFHEIAVPGPVSALRVFDVGAGPELIIACTRNAVDAVSGVYAWNGVSMREVGPGLPPDRSVTALEILDTGAGRRLWCAASTTLYIWNGAQWDDTGLSASGPINSMGVITRPNGLKSIFVSGIFSTAGATVASNIAEILFCGPNCSADFNADNDPGTDADIQAFFACLAGNCCPTCGTSDFNNDGDFGTDADIESFFRVLAGGPC